MKSKLDRLDHLAVIEACAKIAGKRTFSANEVRGRLGLFTVKK